MKKIALHWQILIALVLGALLGFLLTPSYHITESSLETLEKKAGPPPLVRVRVAV